MFSNSGNNIQKRTMIQRLLNALRTAIVTLTVATAAWSCGTQPSSYTTIEGNALGTFVVVKYSGEITQDEVIAHIRNTDSEAIASMSIFDQNSLLSRVNSNLTDSLDSHITYNIELATRYYELSNGAYDITVRPLTEAWGFAQKRASEAEPNVDSLLEFVGMEKMRIEQGRIVKSDSRLQIDLNSIAKGYVVDLVAAKLDEADVEDYMINIGGEIRCRGRNNSGNIWSIGIETPYDGNMSSDAIEKIITVDNCAVATSGNYRRFYLDSAGRKVAHTIDPHTGYSAVSDLLSATVVAPTCAEADAAATMFMAMGSEGGALELAQRCEQEYGWRYYFIYADGEAYRIECSEEYR